MITSTYRWRTRRVLRPALVISLVLHLAGSLMYFVWDGARTVALARLRREAPPDDTFVTVSSSFSVRRRPVPAPAPRQKVHVVPRPPPVPPLAAHVPPHRVPTAAPPAPRHELAAVAPRAPPQPPPHRRTSVGSTRAVTALPPAHTAPEREVAGLSDERIAAMQRDFQRAIAQSRSASDPLRVQKEPPAAPHRFQVSMAGVAGDMRTAQGTCDPVKSWNADGFDYYYVACDVVFSDGTSARQPVPWPVRFPPEADPFVGTIARTTPLAPPLPGWKLPASEFVSKELRQYAHEKGVDL